MANPSLQSIYNRLSQNSNTYKPSTAETFTDWATEAGDRVTMKQGNTSYDTPVNEVNVKWNNGATVSLSNQAEKKRQPVSKASARKYSGGGGGARNDKIFTRQIADDEGRISVVEQTADKLDGIVGDWHYDSDGNIVIENGSGIRLKKGSTEFGVYTSGNLDGGVIVTKINNEATTTIKGKYIEIDGDTTIDGSVIAQSLSGKDVGCAKLEVLRDIEILAGNLYLDIGNIALEMGGVSATSFHFSGDTNSFSSCIVDATASGNTLTLRRSDGTTVTFNRAVDHWTVTAANGNLTVTAYPASGSSLGNKRIGLMLNGARTITENGEQTYSVMFLNDEGTPVATGASMTANVNVNPYPNSMSITRVVAGRSAAGQDTYYGKLYYWDDDSGSYEPASSGNQYWYRSSTSKPGTTTVHY